MEKWKEGRKRRMEGCGHLEEKRRISQKHVLFLSMDGWMKKKTKGGKGIKQDKQQKTGDEIQHLNGSVKIFKPVIVCTYINVVLEKGEIMRVVEMKWVAGSVTAGGWREKKGGCKWKGKEQVFIMVSNFDTLVLHPVPVHPSSSSPTDEHGKQI